MHFPVLNLHRLLNALFKIDDDLLRSPRLNILIDVAIGADQFKIDIWALKKT